MNRLFPRIAALLFLLFALIGCNATSSAGAIVAGQPTPRPIVVVTPIPAPPAPAQPTPAPADAPAPVLGYRVVASYPHDPGAFTQGLVYIGANRFYESTGLYGQSTLREVNLADGSIVPGRLVSLENQYFAEGIAVVDDRIFQLTWQECTGFIYDTVSFAQVGTFDYRESDGSCVREGWGLTYDGERLIMSDGSDTLSFLDAAALADGRFEVLGSVRVRDGATPIRNLNELEYINGAVYANIWLTDRIARIDPTSGRVTAWIDLTGLLQPPPGARVDVLNGIAYDVEQNRLFVTGKWWPTLFEIELIDATLNLPLISAG